MDQINSSVLVQLGIAIAFSFLLLFKSFILVKCLFGLPILVVVFFTVECSLRFEVGPRSSPYILKVRVHHGYSLLSPILFLSQGLVHSNLGLGSVHERLYHRDV